MSDQITQPKKSEFECKHALYFNSVDGTPADLLLIKEYEYTPDGERVGKLRQIYDHKRPYWITKKFYRDHPKFKHNDKKEWEDLDRVDMHFSTERELGANVMRKLERIPGQRIDMRQIAQSPYVYGTDVNSCVLAKHNYLSKWPHRVSPNKVAVMDIESDVLNPFPGKTIGEPIMVSLTMGKQLKLVVVKSYMEGVPNPEERIRKAFHKYLGETIKENPGKEPTRTNLIESRGLELEVEFTDTPGQAIASIFRTAHEWSPDVLAYWNMDFDMTEMIACLEREGYDLAEVFSDPAIPRAFRQFKYKQGPAQKVTASGKTMALAPAERWHEVICPASWYALDAMCVYLKLRVAGGKEPSYALDNILKKHLGIRKLKFKELKRLEGTGLPWHREMQRNFKVEYCIYNLFDCISVELLDEVTTDLRSMISLMCGHSEYRKFPSQPRRTWDDLHFFALEHKKVAASTSNKMVDDNDQHVVGIDDWIVTLPTHLVENNGIAVLEELPNVKSYLRAHVGDLDVEGTYPNVEIIMNISKRTTAKELCYIRGVTQEERRAIGVNLSAGHVNAVEICRTVYKAPSFDQILERFDQKRAL